MSTDDSALPELPREPRAASEDPTGEKRKCNFGEECSGKQQRTRLPSMSEPSHSLNKANLEEHDKHTEPWPRRCDEVDFAIAASERGERERSLSWQFSSTDVSQGTLSQEPLNEEEIFRRAFEYRRNALNNAGITLFSKAASEELKARDRAIVQSKLSEEREQEVSQIAEKLYKDCEDIFRGPFDSDDFVRPIHNALSSMDSGKNFDLFEEAGMVFRSNISMYRYLLLTLCYLDWEPSLKPSIQPCKYSLDKKADDMLPSPLPPMKTPCPSITIGLSRSSIVKKLMALGLGETQASDFLHNQQRLCSDPTQSTLPILFPTILITNHSRHQTTWVDDLNEAATCGACMTNLQRKFAKFTADSVSPNSYHSKEPLAFVIRISETILSLSVHFTTLEDGVRFHDMRKLESADFDPQEGLNVFFKKVGRVMSWASSEFMDDIVEQFVLVERAERKQ